MKTRRPLTPSICRSVLVVAASLAAASIAAQQTKPTDSQPAVQQQAGPALLPAPSAAPRASAPSPFVLTSIEQGKDARAVTESELRQQLLGKTFYLRTGYLDNMLHFDEKGKLDGSSPRAPYTLSLVEITHVRLEKHKLEVEGVRYGLHFLGSSATEDQTAAVDKVRLTTRKKPLVITIDREEVTKPKKEKEKKEKHHGPQSANQPAQAQTVAPAPAAAPEEEAERHRPMTDSEAASNRELAQALDTVFATGIDDRLIATLPDYWKLFYLSTAEHRAYRPAEANVLRQGNVDQKAKLISAIDPPSNEFAQKNGVAGMAMYHVVVGTDGKAREIAVGRPIGFGLDENAVKSIQQAKFEPAMKGGQPVPVMLDLLVQFRIYSKLTAEPSTTAAATSQPSAPILPGPYTANAPKPQPAAEGAPAAAPSDTGQQQSPAPSETAPAPAPAPDATKQHPAQQQPEQQPPVPQPQ
ncbi:energy transducer TonB [Occallatibacter riparius]|uniref:Energy transducer TonB n=1 Tax=Occallatibacter riparius TaxID=1002689 RepID=A0A9J7BNA5_9BACT|nr:energy transducer TonB [Occallatibacter riparius]UWZ84195.1 energy transducer TonB [Occallatibacter riparius]